MVFLWNKEPKTTFLSVLFSELSYVVQVRAEAARPERAEAPKGIAPGIIAISKAPCKGKSLMFCLEF